jgi:hypothetical protein
MAVGSGVAVNRAAHPTGDAGHGFETPQTELNGQIDHLLKGYPSLRHNHSALDVYPIGGEAQNGSGKSVIGGDKIGASADERVGDSGLAQNGYGGGEGFLGPGIDEEPRGATDAEPRQAAKRDVFGNVDAGDGGELLSERGKHIFKLAHRLRRLSPVAAPIAG